VIEMTNKSKLYQLIGTLIPKYVTKGYWPLNAEEIKKKAMEEAVKAVNNMTEDESRQLILTIREIVNAPN
jgi:hypothetical protein